MKRFIKLFLLLCLWALVAIVSAAIFKWGGHMKAVKMPRPMLQHRAGRVGQISPQDIVSVLIVARKKGKGKMLKPQQLTRRRNDLERAVRGAMGRALIRTGKELGEEIGLSETQICNRMAGRSRWTLEEIWELDRVLQFTDAEKLMLIGGTK